jgi:hypothetical protein
LWKIPAKFLDTADQQRILGTAKLEEACRGYVHIRKKAGFVLLVLDFQTVEAHDIFILQQEFLRCGVFGQHIPGLTVLRKEGFQKFTGLPGCLSTDF